MRKILTLKEAQKKVQKLLDGSTYWDGTNSEQNYYEAYDLLSRIKYTEHISGIAQVKQQIARASALLRFYDLSKKPETASKEDVEHVKEKIKYLKSNIDYLTNLLTDMEITYYIDLEEENNE